MFKPKAVFYKRNGKYVQITFATHVRKRKTIEEYASRQFYMIDNYLMEVSAEELKALRAMRDREAYIKEQEQNRKLSLDAFYDLSLTIDDPCFASDNDVENEVISQMTREDLRAAIGQLTKEEQDLIFALYVAEKSEHQYATECGIPRTTIEYRHDKVIQKIKKILKS